jgi:hypothetical protein
MQKVALYISIALLALSCHSLDQRNGTGGFAAVKDSTQVQLLDSAYNFVKATEGDKVDFSFRFRNIGNKPLIIQNVTASCGCTKPSWPQEPIPPGGMASIKAEFNTEGRLGPAFKLIHVVSNAKPAFPSMKLTGMVVKKGS